MKEFDFEGKKVKPNKQGRYKCPFKCGRPDYPQPSWKTEKGFEGHMEKCQGKPSVLEAKKRKNAELSEKQKAKAEDILKEVPFKKGDTIHFVREVIVKPEREWNEYFKRWVRKRYEAVKRFDPVTIKVESIVSVPERVNIYGSSWRSCVKINGQFIGEVCESESQCKERAKEMQLNYKQACEFAAKCR